MFVRRWKVLGLRRMLSLIDALCKNGLVESAVAFLDEMTKEGIRPNVVTYNSIIDAFGRSASAECVINPHYETNVSKISSSSLNVIEDAPESEVGDKEDNQIIKFFGQLTAEKTCHAKKENRGKQEISCILEVFQKMHELDIKPNVVTFSAILNACRYSPSPISLIYHLIEDLVI